ncbi:LptM family lipoprotein [Caldifermentibacillus hisashii]|uniref:LptM family lipoprotein n=1 Tax=Caldifermentibacillus hisashii TaxID=996558 RepID=UPI0031FC47AC
MKKAIFLFTIMSICFILSGCLYPEDDQAKRLPNEVEVEAVQKAVDNYYQDTDGILPIKNKDDETDMFMKYLVDFKRIVPQYLSEIPKNAYENGGVFQYVIMNPETNPTVKIFDLRIAEKIREVNYRLVSKEYPPFKEVIGKNAFSLDYKKLGFEEDPMIESPYTGKNLPLIMSGEGELYVDYTNDLYQLWETGKLSKVKPGEDIRIMLAEQSIFVPAYSLPYTIDEQGKPVFMEKKE